MAATLIEIGLETDRQIAWLETHIKKIAPQALVVPAHLMLLLNGASPRFWQTSTGNAFRGCLSDGLRIGEISDLGIAKHAL